MARQLAVACSIYVVLVLQTCGAGDIAMGSFQPWLPGLAVVACGLVIDGPASLVWAGILGLGVDCQSMDCPGLNLVVATLIASGLIAFRSDNRSHGVISVGLLVLSSSFVWRTATSIIHAFVDRHSFVMVDLAASAGWEGFCSSSSAIVVMVGWRLMLISIRPQKFSSMSLNNRWSMLTEK